MSSYGVYLLYCFTSGLAYTGFFGKHSSSGWYWAGLLGLALFNVVLCSVLKVK